MPGRGAATRQTKKQAQAAANPLIVFSRQHPVHPEIAAAHHGKAACYTPSFGWTQTTHRSPYSGTDLQFEWLLVGVDRVLFLADHLWRTRIQPSASRTATGFFSGLRSVLTQGSADALRASLRNTTETSVAVQEERPLWSLLFPFPRRGRGAADPDRHRDCLRPARLERLRMPSAWMDLPKAFADPGDRAGRGVLLSRRGALLVVGC